MDSRLVNPLHFCKSHYFDQLLAAVEKAIEG